MGKLYSLGIYVNDLIGKMHKQGRMKMGQPTQFMSEKDKRCYRYAKSAGERWDLLERLNPDIYKNLPAEKAILAEQGKL